MAVPRLGAGTSPWGQSIGSRNSLDDTRRFRELVNAVAALDAPSLILDGEIANLDRQLIFRFEWLRPGPRRGINPADIYGLRSIGTERRRSTHATAAGAARGARGTHGRPPARRVDATATCQWPRRMGGGPEGHYEGMVAKDPQSTYTLGRTLSGLKVKQKGYRQEARGFQPACVVRRVSTR